MYVTRNKTAFSSSICGLFGALQQVRPPENVHATL